MFRTLDYSTSGTSLYWGQENVSSLERCPVDLYTKTETVLIREVSLFQRCPLREVVRR